MSGIPRMVGAVWYCDGIHTTASVGFTPKLTELKKRGTDIWTPGESLGIETTDIYTVTHVVGGKTCTATAPVNDITLKKVIWGCILNKEAFDGYNPANFEAAWASAWCLDCVEPSGSYAEIADESGAALGVDDLVANTALNNFGGIMLNNKGEPVFLPSEMAGALLIKSGYKDYQLAGINITIRDASGNIKEEATRALQFKVYQRGEGPSDGKNGGGLASTAATFHVGAGANQSITVGLSDMRASALGLKSKDGSQTVSISTRDNALAALSAFDNAIESALDQLTSIGAVEARIEYTMKNIDTSTENVQASESTIRDADMAREMTNFTRDNVLTQAAQAMLAQANQDASSILGLLA